MNKDADQFWHSAADSLRTDILRLILLPTEQCNFRCKYCYEYHTDTYMSKDTIQRVKRYIEYQLNHLNMLRLSWFGGEPLLALSVIEEISVFIISMFINRAPIVYKAEMTTNGYLLEVPVVERLLMLGIDQYQITLDGPKVTHDETRICANGTGSFYRIWNNLLAIRNSPIPIKILLQVHLTPQNVKYMPAFLAEIRDTFLEDERFCAVLMPVGRYGGPNDGVMGVLGNQEKMRLLPRLEAVLQVNARRNLLYPIPNSCCYASRHNAFVIRANGSVCKCTLSLDDPANTIGRLLPDGTLKLNEERHKLWLRGWVSRDETILACPAIGITRESSKD